MPQRGAQYDHTAGSVIDYPKLARFLCSETRLLDATAFIDLACGTGRLLQEIRAIRPDLPLIGIDASAEQLAVARDRVTDMTFHTLDLTRLSTLPAAGTWEGAAAHAGYCFINTLRPEERDQLFEQILTTPGIARLGFEIQNEDHQQEAYLEDVWYERILESGVTLRSKWIRGSGQQNRHLLIEYLSKSLRCQDSVDIYGWLADDCTAYIRGKGWEQVSLLHASYRGEAKPPSHWLVVADRG